MPPVQTIDEYIASFPRDVQEKLDQVRMTVQEAAPEATETMKYGMPTFMLDGNLVYFAAFKNHIGFYPAPTGVKEFEKALSSYKTVKRSITKKAGRGSK